MNEKRSEEMSKEELLAANKKLNAENADLIRKNPPLNADIPQSLGEKEERDTKAIRLLMANRQTKLSVLEITVGIGLAKSEVEKCLRILLAKGEITGEATGYELTPLGRARATDQ
jgi:hypothetical protein